MAIDIAPFEQPIREAGRKLEADTGAAARAQADLAGLSTSLNGYSSRHKADANRLQGDWVGDRGDLFGVKAKERTDALDEAATWASKTASSIGDATALITQAQQEVDRLLREFDGDARTLAQAAAASGDPGAEQQAIAVISGMSSRYAKEAADVVDAAKGRLAQIAAGMEGTQPSGVPGSGGIGSRSGGGAGDGSGGGGGGGTGPSGGPVTLTPPSDQYGSGTKIKLPNGQTVQAPNERAAIAVRAALSRLGLPYVWGGTDPNRGMDCSGLTQWAYGQAGVKIPRVANTQTVGQKVAMSDIQPGDLVIWSGHVAMYIGNNQMVEEPHTGSVCHVVPLRTTNAGEPLLGVYRPSA